MKALVTGGAGFIGSHVVDLFLEHGLDVVVVDNLSTGRRQNLNPRATSYELDIRDPALENVFRDARPDYVSHHAAQIDVRRSVADPLFDADVNIMGSLRLLEYARQYEVQHFVYTSSGGAVYGEQTRDFVYVGDCARANLLALTAPHASGEYNIGAGRETSVNELFATLKAITGYRREAHFGPAKLGETQRIHLDCSKAEQALGWRPGVSLEEGLRRTVAHFRDEEE